MKMEARFDDALPRFARALKDAWGTHAVDANLFLRDASGRLTLVLLEDGRSAEERRRLGKSVATSLQSYVDGAGFSIATPEELFDESLRQTSDALTINLRHEIFSGSVRLVDRRMVGGDWLRSPVPEAGPPPRFVFGSLKGGVGRSTALCIVAAEFARKGKRVLAIDMDLEAPGLGTFLLSADTLPDFGLLDFLVESEVGQLIDDSFLTDMKGASWLGTGFGRVDVIPAIGKRSVENPQNVLAKIARAYLADAGVATSSTFQDRMVTLLKAVADPLRYDLILIDARAGLHETTAAALLGLGAETLLFGLDQSQTYEGYNLLFSHLGTLPAASISQWCDRLTFVQAKASVDMKSHAKFTDKMQSLVDDNFRKARRTNEDNDLKSLKDTFEVHWGELSDDLLSIVDDESRIPTVAVYEDDRFRLFDPSVDRDILSGPLYSSSYSQLLELIEDRLDEPSHLDGR